MGENIKVILEFWIFRDVEGTIYSISIAIPAITPAESPPTGLGRFKAPISPNIAHFCMPNNQAEITRQKDARIRIRLADREKPSGSGRAAKGRF
jgi:hypothetical protein